GTEARLYYLGHVLMENRNGLAVAAKLSLANGTAERETALALIKQRPPKPRMTLIGDKAYDTRNFVRELRASGVVSHVAQNDKRQKDVLSRKIEKIATTAPPKRSNVATDSDITYNQNLSIRSTSSSNAAFSAAC